MSKLWEKSVFLDKMIESFTVGNDPELDKVLVPVSYTHLTLPTIYSV